MLSKKFGITFLSIQYGLKCSLFWWNTFLIRFIQQQFPWHIVTAIHLHVFRTMLVVNYLNHLLHLSIFGPQLCHKNKFTLKQKHTAFKKMMKIQHYQLQGTFHCRSQNFGHSVWTCDQGQNLGASSSCESNA